MQMKDIGEEDDNIDYHRYGYTAVALRHHQQSNYSKTVKL
jgi:hypothetical protein